VIYKLVEIQWKDQVRGTAKFSAEKKTYPGRKQVFRFKGGDGSLSHDVIALEDETFPDADPLLVQVMCGGRRVDSAAQCPPVTAKKARERFLENRKSLPPRLLALGSLLEHFPVQYSARLEEMCQQMQHHFVEAV
jgi:nicotinate phosphoribosyltransferase